MHLYLLQQQRALTTICVHPCVAWLGGKEEGEEILQLSDQLAPFGNFVQGVRP